MTKYITMLQGWQWSLPGEFERRHKLKVKSLGYGDSSSTTYVFMIRTKKSVREVEDMVWAINGGGWAKVTAEDPRF